MDTFDILILLVRWLHNLAAVAWVGGSIFYVFVVRPARKNIQSNDNAFIRELVSEFRPLVNTAIGILLITGIILILHRLTSGYTTSPYIAILTLKIAIGLYMFYIVRFLRRSSYSEDKSSRGSGIRRSLVLISGTNALLAFGVIVFLLANILRDLFEKELAA